MWVCEMMTIINCLCGRCPYSLLNRCFCPQKDDDDDDDSEKKPLSAFVVFFVMNFHFFFTGKKPTNQKSIQKEFQVSIILFLSFDSDHFTVVDDHGQYNNNMPTKTT